MTALKQIRVGSRASALALIQTEEILSQLRLLYPGREFVVSRISTGGDRDKESSLVGMERGVFVKEIENALLGGEIDLAVHSLKDLPSELAPGLTIAAVGQRHDPRDVLVSRLGLPVDRLPPGARIGTSSPRRAAQISAIRPDLRVLPIRGNVDTRLRKAQGDDYDGAVLAAAGILRLGRQQEITQYLSPRVWIPAPGQGALAVEVRADDKETFGLVSQVDHWDTRVSVSAERAFLSALGGGCRVPLAAYGQVKGDRLYLLGMVATEDGHRLFRAQVVGDPALPEEAGRRLAEALVGTGAAEIIGEGED